MKDFKQYQAEKTANSEEMESAAAELTRKALAAYEGKSNAFVLAEIIDRAAQAKRTGTLSDEELEAFYAQFAPMLEEAQQQRLRGVIDRLKSL